MRVASGCHMADVGNSIGAGFVSSASIALSEGSSTGRRRRQTASARGSVPPPQSRGVSPLSQAESFTMPASDAAGK